MKSCCKDALNENDDDSLESKAGGGFYRLKEKWKLNSMWQLLLVIGTFAIGGTTCGMVGKQVMHLIGPDHKGLWILMYILLITILWPVCVLIISVPLGQFNFFKHYLKGIGRRLFTRNKA